MQIPARPLSAEERNLLEWLLTTAARTDAGPLLAQIPGLRVVGCCGCGCPSLDFVEVGERSGAEIVADAEGLSPEGTAIGVLVWARAGRLTEMEVYDFEGAHPISLPRPADLRPAADAEAV